MTQTNDSEKNNEGGHEFVRPSIQSLHTLDSDLLSSIKSDNYASNIVKVITHDDDKNKEVENEKLIGLKTLKQFKKPFSFKINFNSTSFYVSLSVFLMALMGGGAYYIINQTIQDITPVVDTTSTSTVPVTKPVATSTNILLQGKNLFNAEIIVPIRMDGLTKVQILELIEKSKQDLLSKKIKDKINISFAPDISFTEFLNKIQYSGPETLIRSLHTSQIYNFGLYHKQGGVFETYILTKIDIFDLAFSGMLDWEYSMFLDLGKLYTYTPNISTSTINTASTTKILPVIKDKNSLKFTDKVIKNIDTRTYKDTEKGIEIVYGFINKEYLLITSGEESFVDIVNKLTINSILR